MTEGELFKINDKIFCEVSPFNGKIGIDIRRWYEKEGEFYRTQKGIWMKPEEWNALVQNFELLKTYVSQKLIEIEGK